MSPGEALVQVTLKLGEAQARAEKAEAQVKELTAALAEVLALAEDTSGWCACQETEWCVARRDATAKARAALAKVVK